MNHLEGDNLDGCSIAVLLRLAADGELTVAQRGRLEAHLAQHPEDAERLAFDQKLREACGRACCPGGCAPAGLRERVVASCCQGGGSGAGGRTRRMWIGRAVTRYGALAAMIGLVAILGFLVWRPGGREMPPSQRFAASLAGFVRAEHVRCTDGGPSIETKFTIHEAGSVPAEFSSIVGHEVTLPCLIVAESRGLHFVDAGLCHPPGGDALHIRFRLGEAGGLVSLWVQADDGRLPMADGVTYTQGQGGDCVRFWRVDGIRYVLVCPDDSASPLVVAALDSPRTVRPF
ncbi:MAG: hypothetical protein IPJ41_01000 [Phycisphaerales bacterium]|nr:hypothetical protein [Phycisphaerales bacterium]